MKWVVTRQHYYYSGLLVVEIAQGGHDFSNADALCSKYPGEFKEFNDPVEVAETAIAIATAWRKDEPGKRIYIAHGATGGFTMEFEPTTIKEVRSWAAKAYDALPKCDQCGELLPEDYLVDEFGDCKFCREYCAEKNQREQEKLNQEELNA